jgi:cob(I)alamin adenosyltransferase
MPIFIKDLKNMDIQKSINWRKLGAKIYGFAKGHPFCNKELKAETLEKECHEAIKTLQNQVFSEEYDLLIMDEILISVRDGYLPEKELIDFIKSKPENLELVMTGRGATENIIKLADYVSNVTKVRHPYDRDIMSRKGVEY